MFLYGIKSNKLGMWQSWSMQRFEGPKIMVRFHSFPQMCYPLIDAYVKGTKGVTLDVMVGNVGPHGLSARSEPSCWL